MTAIETGLDRCVRERTGIPGGAQFGLLMNRASVDRDVRPACEVLAEAFPGQLAALFTPQHGLWGEQQANMVESPHGQHAELGVPIYSLYSETRRPTPEMLGGLDLFVVDLQDVGTRVYTFVWTVLNCLSACADAGIPMLVLDRPNPIGGRLVEGPLLDLKFRSFVGEASIPMRHGLTLGELARLLNDEENIGASLDVVPVRGWKRSDLFDAFGRHWIPPSPNLPRFESALVYPGQVLLEGTNLSEGRGTTTPFEVVGAPFINPDGLYHSMNGLSLPGVKFLPTRFTPAFDKWAGESCGGVSLHVTDPDEFRPLQTTVALIAEVKRRWPDHFTWIEPPYEYEMFLPPIDIICGGTWLRETLDSVSSRDDDGPVALERLNEVEWWQRVSPILLYDEPAQTY